jgi:HlyD family secretion protein
MEEKNSEQVQPSPVPGKKKRGKKRKTIRRIILALILVVILGGAAWLGIMSLRQEYTVTYDEYSATTGTISNALSFSGSLQARSNVTYTASSPATVRAVYVTREQNVKAGDALMRLSSGQTVEAEFDGRINQLYVAEGDKVSAGANLVQVVDFEHLQVSVRVDEYDISSVHAGDQCRVSTVATENTFTTTIDSINYVSSSTGSVAYYTATAYVDVAEGIYPGMQVTVTIPKEEAADVVILREAALSFDLKNQAFVYTMNESGELETTYVKTGVSNGNYVEIRDGLKSGDTVYVAVETTTDSFSSLLSGLFGSQQFNRQQNRTRNTNNSERWNNSNPGSGNPGSGGGFTPPSGGSNGSGGGGR